jgi:hypothetical protein
MAILYLTRNRFTRIPGQSWSKHNIIEYIRLVPKESYGIAIQNLLLIPCSETEMCTPIGSLLTTVLLPPNDLVRAAVNDNSNHDHNDTHITQQNTHTEVETTGIIACPVQRLDLVRLPGMYVDWLKLDTLSPNESGPIPGDNYLIVVLRFPKCQHFQANSTVQRHVDLCWSKRHSSDSSFCGTEEEGRKTRTVVIYKKIREILKNSATRAKRAK